MPLYRFGVHTADPDEPGWSEMLSRAYAAKSRPLCLCKAEPNSLEMYIALVRGVHQIKRMPNTGARHHTSCEHYDPPAELSGLGQVMGVAVREDAALSATTLALDFALTKGAARAGAAALALDHDSVRSDGTKLTLRATLHFLLDRAGLTRWYPRMAGKRSWHVVRREILNAAQSMHTKGMALTEVLYLPEKFRADDATEIGARRAHALARLVQQPGGRMIFIGCVKKIDHGRYGQRLFLRHLDTPLLMADDMAKKVERRFASELGLWGALDETELMFIGTVSQHQSGSLNLETVCLVNVNAGWLPFESAHEHALLEHMGGVGRRFIKGLRYNLPKSKPLASVVLQDTGNVPTAVYLVPGDAGEDFQHTLAALIAESDMPAVVWTPAQGESLPTLPEISLAPS